MVEHRSDGTRRRHRHWRGNREWVLLLVLAAHKSEQQWFIRITDEVVWRSGTFQIRQNIMKINRWLEQVVKRYC